MQAGSALVAAVVAGLAAGAVVILVKLSPVDCTILSTPLLARTALPKLVNMKRAPTSVVKPVPTKSNPSEVSSSRYEYPPTNVRALPSNRATVAQPLLV